MVDSAYVVRGSYPEVLLDAWDEFEDQRGSDSVRPGKLLRLNLPYLLNILRGQAYLDPIFRRSSGNPALRADRARECGGRPRIIRVRQDDRVETGLGRGHAGRQDVSRGGSQGQVRGESGRLRLPDIERGKS